MYYEVIQLLHNNYDFSLLGKNKVDILIKGILKGNVLTDEEGKELLKCTSQYYYKIKELAFQRAIRLSYVIPPTNKTIEDRYNLMYMELALSKKLRSQGKSNLSNFISEPLLKSSKEFHLSEITLSILKPYAYLKAMYKSQDAENLIEEIDAYSEIVYIESKLEGLLCRLILYFNNRVEISIDESIKINKFKTQVYELSKKASSYRITFLSYLILCFTYEIQCDYNNLIKTCEEAIKKIKTFDISKLPFIALSSFYLRIIPGLLMLKQFNKTKQFLINTEEVIPERHRNHFHLLLLKATYHLHQKQYQEAHELLLPISKKKNLTPTDKELYLIYKAYAGILTGNKVRIGKLMNEVPIFSKDKRGMNINIITLQVLRSIQQGRYGGVIDRIDALKRYSSRHLRNNQNFRSNTWINFLIRLQQSNFKKKIVLHKAKKEIEDLNNNPIGNYNYSLEKEPVPYEFLVDFVLERISG